MRSPGEYSNYEHTVSVRQVAEDGCNQDEQDRVAGQGACVGDELPPGERALERHERREHEGPAGVDRNPFLSVRSVRKAFLTGSSVLIVTGGSVMPRGPSGNVCCFPSDSARLSLRVGTRALFWCADVPDACGVVAVSIVSLAGERGAYGRWLWFGAVDAAQTALADVKVHIVHETEATNLELTTHGEQYSVACRDIAGVEGRHGRDEAGWRRFGEDLADYVVVGVAVVAVAVVERQAFDHAEVTVILKFEPMCLGE